MPGIDIQYTQISLHNGCFVHLDDGNGICVKPIILIGHSQSLGSLIELAKIKLYSGAFFTEQGLSK